MCQRYFNVEIPRIQSTLESIFIIIFALLNSNSILYYFSNISEFIGLVLIQALLMNQIISIIINEACSVKATVLYEF